MAIQRSSIGRWAAGIVHQRPQFSIVRRCTAASHAISGKFEDLLRMSDDVDAADAILNLFSLCQLFASVRHLLFGGR